MISNSSTRVESILFSFIYVEIACAIGCSDLGLYGVDVRKEIKSMVKNMLTQKNVFLFENYQGFILTDFGDEKIVF
jgi:hypothetical protein